MKCVIFITTGRAAEYQRHPSATQTALPRTPAISSAISSSQTPFAQHPSSCLFISHREHRLWADCNYWCPPKDAKVTTVSHHPTSEKLQGWEGSTKVKVLFVCVFVCLICCDPAAGHTGLQMQGFLHLCSMNLHREWLTDQPGILYNLLPALHKEL